jgi:hypothetical protein
MAEVLEQEPQLFDEFQVNDLVEHPQWGIGSIIHRSGRGEHTKLVVTFPELEGNGQKRLKAAFAKLKKIEDSKEREAEEEAEKQRAEEVAEEKKAADENAEESDDDDDDEEEVFDEKAAAEAMNIEDEREEVAKAEVKEEPDWEEEDDS